MKHLAPCLIRRLILGVILGPIVAVFVAPPAGARPPSAKDIICGWQKGADGYTDFACHIAGQHTVPNAVMRGEAPTPTPTPTQEIVRLVARTVRGSAVDPRLVLAVIAAESGFDRQAVSPKNAVGLMQLMPETIARFGVRHPFDAEENIRAGTSYLELLLRKYGNLALALAAYDAGEGPVLSYGAVPPYAETTEYVARVLRLYARYRGIPFERSAPPVERAAKAAPVKAAAARAKSAGGCDVVCRLAAQLDAIGGRPPVSPSDAAWLASAVSARTD